MSTRPPSLGRGLAALIPTDVLHVGGETAAPALRVVSLDRIRPNPEQPRTHFFGPALDELAESIREHGILTPLLVRRDPESRDFVLIAGERRLRAAGLAGLEEVPVFVREDVDDREQLELALVENLQREDLDPIETAEAYNRLCEEFGLTQEQVARRVGRDRATVANAIRLLKLPLPVLARVREGDLSAGHAKALLPITDETVLLPLVQQVVDRELSVRATERLVSSIIRPAKPSKGRAVHAYASDLLTRTLGTKVTVSNRSRGGSARIVIEAYSGEELERLIGRLSSLG
jgi:ParB family chromosome partitioning protein